MYFMLLLGLLASQFFTLKVKLSLVFFFLVWLLAYCSTGAALRNFLLTNVCVVGSWLAPLWVHVSRLFYLSCRNLYLGDLCIYVAGQTTVFNFFFFSWSFMCRAVLVLYVFFIIG